MSFKFFQRLMMAAGWCIRALTTMVIALLPLHASIAGDALDTFILWPIVPDEELSELRGGFISADGLEINVGLEQLVMIDGSLKTQFRLNLSGLSRKPDQAQAASTDQSKLLQFIQTGDKNLVTPDVPANFSAGALTIIQNSLDAQVIQNLTLLRVDVSRFSQFRTGALGEAINLEMIRSLR